MYTYIILSYQVYHIKKVNLVYDTPPPKYVYFSIYNLSHKNLCFDIIM